MCLIQVITDPSKVPFFLEMQIKEPVTAGPPVYVGVLAFTDPIKMKAFPNLL